MNIVVENEDYLQRIDKYLSDYLDESRSTIVKMMDSEFILVNGKKVKPSYIVNIGDKIEVKDGVITCTENTFKKLCEDISEFDKFKSWLNEQNSINIVYKKEL